MIKIFIGWQFAKLGQLKFSFNGGYNFNVSSQITSTREALISYSGYYPYLYDITIYDGVYDFGTYQVNQSSTIDLEIFDPLTIGLDVEYVIEDSRISIVLKSEFTTDGNVLSFYNPNERFVYFSQNQNELNSIFDVQNSYVKLNPITIGVKLKL